MGQIQGSQQNVLISTDDGATYKTLVCLRTSSVNTTADVTTEQTNCGSFSSVGEPSMTVDFDAICETNPTAEQVTYSTLLNAAVNKTLIIVNFEDTTSGAYIHEFSGYVSDLTINQSTTEFINFSGSIVSSGELYIGE